jgi:hypothetical protein
VTDEPDIPYCCAACRLLQPAATECIDCGSVVIGRLDTEHELLRWQSLSFVPSQDSDYHARSRTVSAIDLPSPGLAHEAVTRAGVAHALGSPLRSLLDDAPILAEQISLITRWRRSVFLRRVHAAPFAIDGLAVTGVIRLLPHTRPPRERVADDDPRLARLGIPPHFLTKANLEVVTLHPGDSVTATGVVETAPRDDLALYRDAELAQVMRGRAGSVVRVAV